MAADPMAVCPKFVEGLRSDMEEHIRKYKVPQVDADDLEKCIQQVTDPLHKRPPCQWLQEDVDSLRSLGVQAEEQLVGAALQSDIDKDTKDIKRPPG